MSLIVRFLYGVLISGSWIRGSSLYKYNIVPSIAWSAIVLCQIVIFTLSIQRTIVTEKQLHSTGAR